MKKKNVLFGMPALLLVFGLSVSSCATMFHTNRAQIVSASGSTAPVEVRDNGVVVYDGELPASFPVKTSDHTYDFTYQTAQGEKRNGRIARGFNPLVIGSFILGGFPVLIDFFTGNIMQWEKTTAVP